MHEILAHSLRLESARKQFLHLIKNLKMFVFMTNLFAHFQFLKYRPLNGIVQRNLTGVYSGISR
jgi:hypothetical protein